MTSQPKITAPRPKHRASTAERPVDAVPTDAKCTCSSLGFVKTACPRHRPAAYADFMARHAVDSIDPVDRDPWSGQV